MASILVLRCEPKFKLMSDFIQTKDQYDQCIQRLNYLKTIQPQTEGMKREIEMIDAEVKKFEEKDLVK